MNFAEKYPQLQRALDLLDPSNYTKEELEAYDKQIESNRLHKLKMESIVEEAREIGRQEGIKMMDSMVYAMLDGKTDSEIAAEFKLDILEVENLLSEIRYLRNS
jgi:hypothetical protein